MMSTLTSANKLSKCDYPSLLNGFDSVDTKHWMQVSDLSWPGPTISHRVGQVGSCPDTENGSLLFENGQIRPEEDGAEISEGREVGQIGDIRSASPSYNISSPFVAAGSLPFDPFIKNSSWSSSSTCDIYHRGLPQSLPHSQTSAVLSPPATPRHHPQGPPLPSLDPLNLPPCSEPDEISGNSTLNGRHHSALPDSVNELDPTKLGRYDDDMQLSRARYAAGRYSSQHFYNFPSFQQPHEQQRQYMRYQRQLSYEQTLQQLNDRSKTLHSESNKLDSYRLTTNGENSAYDFINDVRNHSISDMHSSYLQPGGEILYDESLQSSRSAALDPYTQCARCGALFPESQDSGIYPKHPSFLLCNSCRIYESASESGVNPTMVVSSTGTSPSSRKVAARRPAQHCSNCGTTSTTLWRRSSKGEPVCNACGLYYKLHNVRRPMTMRKDNVQTRKRRTNGIKSAGKAVTDKSTCKTDSVKSQSQYKSRDTAVSNDKHHHQHQQHHQHHPQHQQQLQQQRMHSEHSGTNGNVFQYSRQAEAEPQSLTPGSTPPGVPVAPAHLFDDATAKVSSCLTNGTADLNPYQNKTSEGSVYNMGPFPPSAVRVGEEATNTPMFEIMRLASYNRDYKL